MKYLQTKDGSRIEIKSLSEAVIRGYGVIFGGRDTAGETFTANTDYEVKRIIGTPIYIEHSLTGENNPVGEVINYGIDDIGIWIEAKLNSSLAIVQDYLKKIQKNLVGWSSGTAGHLARRVKNVITKWPIIEWSLTTNPAEKRTIQYGLQQIKSLDLVNILEAEQENGIEENANENNLFVETIIRINTKL